MEISLLIKAIMFETRIPQYQYLVANNALKILPPQVTRVVMFFMDYILKSMKHLSSYLINIFCKLFTSDRGTTHIHELYLVDDSKLYYYNS